MSGSARVTRPMLGFGMGVLPELYGEHCHAAQIIAADAEQHCRLNGGVCRRSDRDRQNDRLRRSDRG
jgi:hypothetical protein